MQWGQIKSIFILSFLILNIFLLQQFLDKINRANYETLAQQASFEERLATEEITYGELPERGQKETYVSAKRYQFSIEDIEGLNEKLENQQIVFTNNSETLLGRFIKPIKIDLDNNIESAIATIRSQVLFGDQYKFWSYYPNENLLLFLQEQNGHTVYFNESGLLAVILNEKGEITKYSQSLLTEVVSQSEEQTVIDPISAIEVLFNNSQTLVQKDRITSMRLGYHTLVPLEGGLQVFAPTWEIRVNDERTYFVNAMEAQMIPHNEKEFIIRVKDFIEREIDLLIGSEDE
ncbi:two-component system regulatory protein YycI [Bacillaceae bacterium W0354]